MATELYAVQSPVFFIDDRANGYAPERRYAPSRNSHPGIPAIST